MANYRFEFLNGKGKILKVGNHKGHFCGAVQKVKKAIKNRKRSWVFCDLEILVDGEYRQESRWIQQEDGSITEYL